MKENITIDDVNNLYEEFKEHCESAEQYMYPLLFKLDMMMQVSIKKFDKTSNKEKNAMFRTIYKVIGKDYSAYV